MTWLLPDLRDPDIPRVGRCGQGTIDDPDGWVHMWAVEWADQWHWSCCGRTELQVFDTWREAVRFAVNQEWKR